MCSISNLSITLTCFWTMVIVRSCGQQIDGAIGFPEKEENSLIKNKEVCSFEQHGLPSPINDEAKLNPTIDMNPKIAIPTEADIVLFSSIYDRRLFSKNARKSNNIFNHLKTNREPVFLPSVCPINQLYYPGDQKDDWICDCMPSHLYHPATDKCWPAYRKGPCNDKEYLTLPPNTYIPACIPNPCEVDSYVPWNRKCARLGTTTPCLHLYPNAVALGVNATTLQINCVKLNIESRFHEPSLPQAMPTCLPGCKRSINMECTKA